MDSKINHLEFINVINEKGIESLIHFTPTINLLSIYEQGKLLSRSLLEKNEIDDTLLDFIEFLDSIRFDDKNYINLSISFPNHFLFNRFRERTKDKSYIDWCVLKINPKYIYQTDTLFSVTNAASSIAKYNYGITGDIEKFKQLFIETITTKFGSISRGNLLSKYPTDVQAEVLVKNQIDLSDIMQICFIDESELAKAKAAMIGFDTSKFVVDSRLFSNSRL